MLLLGNNPALAQSKKYAQQGQILYTPWQQLKQARTYRKPFRDNRADVNFSNVINAYNSTPTQGQSPQVLLQAALAGFRQAIENTSNTAEVREEATKGLAETINEIVTAYQLIGNESLLKGLRTRFPGSGDPEDPDQISLLTSAANDFAKGMSYVQKDVQKYPHALRAKGTVNATFPYYVENLSDLIGTNGEIVFSEWYQYTELINRYAIAMNSKAKRMFYFGNVDDVDNAPSGNFPGNEDLDFNGDRAQNSAGKEEAKKQFQQSALNVYFNSALIAAMQSKEEFDHNNGYELKRHILDARHGFDDIVAGFNPLKLSGDFVPHQPTENFLDLAKDRINDAVTAERAAKQLNRSYDQDETALRNALESQRNNYIEQLEALTGLGLKDYNNLSTDEDRRQFITAAKSNEQRGRGELGLLYLQTKELQASNQIAHTQLQQAYERIAIIEQEQKQTAKVVLRNGRKLAALTAAGVIANSVQTGTAGNGTFLSTVLYAGALAGIESEKQLLLAFQQAEISGINSAAQVKTILSEQAQLVINIKLSQARVDTNQARSVQLWDKLQRLINSYRQAQSNLVNAYYTNPAYRLERDRTQEKAENSFETAMESTYYAIKAVEYRWGERFNNPVLKLDATLPEALSASFDSYTRAESVFGVHFADNTNNSNNLLDFYAAIQAWDVKMRQQRFPQGQKGTLQLSLKNDILKWGSLSPVVANSLFKEYILTHLVAGANAKNKDLLLYFTTSLVDESLFPNQPNLRIESININLISDSGNSIRGDYSASPAWVELVMLDTANVRSFFAQYPNNDDIVTYQLQEGRTLEKSPFHALVEASIDSYAYPAPAPNIQLTGHSPAVSKWALRIRTDNNNNENLKLRYLNDIQITLKYSYGKPAQISFP